MNFTPVLNYKFEPKDERDHKFHDYHFKLTQGVTVVLPVKSSVRSKMPPVLNQGDLGSCVSNQASNDLRFCLELELKTNPKVTDWQPSRLFIYYNGRLVSGMPLDQDTGLNIRDAMKAISKYSACDEKIWPYFTTKFTDKPTTICYQKAEVYNKISYLSVNQDLKSIKTCIYQGFPIIFGIMVYDSFMSDNAAKTGIIPMPDVNNEQLQGGHCVSIVGYDDTKKQFECMNSWGLNWGDKGFFYLPYDYVLSPDLSSDFWTIRVFSD